jgi:outer membrane lipoprotein-sorting protein
MWASAKFSLAGVRGILAVAAAAVVLLAAPLSSASVKPAALTPAERGDVSRIEDFLNGIKSFKSRFLQVNPDGSVWQGVVYVQRPGRFRFQYDEPIPHLLIANRNWFVHIDREMDTTNLLPLSKTPAKFLVRRDLSFDGGLVVTGFERGAGRLAVRLVDSSNPDIGELTLIFSDRPLALRKWTIRDAQDNWTQVTLQNIEYGVSIDPKLFDFDEGPLRSTTE